MYDKIREELKQEIKNEIEEEIKNSQKNKIGWNKPILGKLTKKDCVGITVIIMTLLIFLVILFFNFG